MSNVSGGGETISTFRGGELPARIEKKPGQTVREIETRREPIMGDTQHVSGCINISHDVQTFVIMQEPFLVCANISPDARTFFMTRKPFLVCANISPDAQIFVMTRKSFLVCANIFPDARTFFMIRKPFLVGSKKGSV
jgi:hypothetical protein